MDRIELIMRRRVVGAFIDADPVFITVTRDLPPTRTAAGGLTSTPGPPLPVQKARIVQNIRRLSPGLVNTEAGEIPDDTFLLIGRHSLDIQVDDTFLWRGLKYRVDRVHPFRFESTLCVLDFDGGPNA